MRFGLTAMAALALVGCVSSGGGTHCVQNQTTQCACPGNRTGLQVCTAAGIYDECVCDGAGTATCNEAGICGPGPDDGGPPDPAVETCTEAGICGPGPAAGGDLDAGVETCNEAGVCGDASMGSTPVRAEYKYVIIVDSSGEENMDGSPGADICGAIADCGGVEMTATSAELTVGQGLVCDGSTTEAPCESGTNRQDPNTAKDRGDNCAGNSSPSDYASLGLGGEIALGFGTDLQGCSVTIAEAAGTDAESYDIYVCQTPVLDAATCIGGGILQSATDGGAISVAVPDAPPRARRGR